MGTPSENTKKKGEEEEEEGKQREEEREGREGRGGKGRGGKGAFKCSFILKSTVMHLYLTFKCFWSSMYYCKALRTPKNPGSYGWCRNDVFV